jgi:hypothetical protein
VGGGLFGFYVMHEIENNHKVMNVNSYFGLQFTGVFVT